MPNKNKIVMLLNSEFFSDARVEREIILLLELDFDVEVLCYENKNLPIDEFRNGYKISRVLGRNLANPLNKNFKIDLENALNELQKREKFILHCHDYEMINIGYLYKKNINSSVILIYDSHEYLKGWPIYKDSYNFINKLKIFIVWVVLRLNEKKAIKNCDYVITINDEIAKRLKSENSIKNKVIVLPNIPISNKFKKRNFYFNDKFNIPKKNIILVNLGSIYQTNKQLDILYKTLLKFSDVSFVFISNFKKFHYLKNKIKNNKILNSKIFFEDFPPSDLHSILSSADVGICHTNTKILAHKIGFSNKFFEYSLSGLPVISTKQNICVEYGNRFKHAVFYNENEKNSLYSAILKMKSNLDYYKANSDLIKKKLDWKKESYDFKLFYKKLHENENI